MQNTSNKKGRKETLTKTPFTSSTSSSTNCSNKTKDSKKKHNDLDIPEYSEDESSIIDGVYYTKEENYEKKKLVIVKYRLRGGEKKLNY
jgi:hypothetical protein